MNKNILDAKAKLSAWDTRLIEVITDCEDDTKRYGNLIEQINGARDCNTLVLACCMKDDHAHRHLALFTALHIVESRFQKACGAMRVGENGLADATEKLRQHIRLISLMMQEMFRQVEQGLSQSVSHWNYADSLLARLLERRLRIAIDETISSLQEQFSCTLTTVLMAAIEPAMKSVQDRLSLRPELPLDMKAFAGTMLGLKCHCNRGTLLSLTDLASDVSQIFKIPRTICLSA